MRDVTDRHTPSSRIDYYLVLIAGSVLLAIHLIAWGAAFTFLRTPSFAAHSAGVLAFGAAGLAAAMCRRRRTRVALMGLLFVAFLAAMAAFPLPKEHGDTTFMGDGTDFAQSRPEFVLQIPWAGAGPALHFRSHLGDAILAKADAAFGQDDESIGKAFETLSHLGGLIFIVELVVVLIVMRASRRACRFAALAMATPLSLTYFGYYEVGYMAASAAAFPLLAVGFTRRSSGATELAGAVQGLHAAFHGIGLIGVAGGVLAAFAVTRERWSRWSAALRFAAFALSFYLGWIVIYVVILKLSIVVDQTTAAIAIRGWSEPFYFDRRLVHPLTTLRAMAEVGAASLAIGVPLLVAAGFMTTWRARIARMAVAYAIPALVFVILWWPSLGVHGDLDLLLGIFGAVMAAAWMASRRLKYTAIALGILALVHVAFWTVVADQSLNRIWIGE